MKFVKIVFFALVLIILAVAGCSYWLYSSLNSPQTHDKSNQFIVIEKGSTPGQIIAKLASEGIISSSIPMQIYLRTFGDAGDLQAGEYQFSSPITPLQVLKELEKGETQTTKLTIPEGFTRFDIAKRIAEKFPQNPPVDDRQILQLMDDTTLIRDLAPEAKNLEGYMYPSTYSFPRETKPVEIIRTMVEQFKKIWMPEWTAKAKSLGRTPHEIITIASLIETETGITNERPIVASVIYNRLSRNIPLGIDVTNIYVAKMQGRWDGELNQSDFDVDSPYNTRKYGGIPPGPVASASQLSIEAALNPAQSEFIYYLRNVELNDGSHWFYISAADFERGKAEYQRWLKKERQEKKVAANN